MKYVILLCDGMADLPIDELNGKTPLEYADTPNMDSISVNSEIGLVKNVPDGMNPGSDVANLAVMGYDPFKYYTGRSPLEAVNMGIDLGENDVAMRCNLVTLSDENDFYDKTMVDYCAGDISSQEAKEIIKSVQENFGNETFSFYNGISYRHCLVWKNGEVDSGYFTPPHDISGRKIGQYINDNPIATPLIKMMKESGELLKNHPVNIERIRKGLRPATHIWFWGQGKKPALSDFYSKTGLKGSVVSAVDLVKGIGKCANMSIPNVEGATGYIDTNFEGKAKAAIDELKNGADYVYIHIEAPDECGHRGETLNKVKSIELIDKKILGYVIDELKKLNEDYSILILPDHPTPLSIKTHSSDPVPYLLYRSSCNSGNGSLYNEKTAESSGIIITEGYKLLDRFIGGKNRNE